MSEAKDSIGIEDFLESYQDRCGCEPQSAIRDVLCELMNISHGMLLDFDEILHNARTVYKEETQSAVREKAWDRAWELADEYSDKPIISSMEGKYDKTSVCWHGDIKDTVYTSPLEFHIDLLKNIAFYEGGK